MDINDQAIRVRQQKRGVLRHVVDIRSDIEFEAGDAVSDLAAANCLGVNLPWISMIRRYGLGNRNAEYSATSSTSRTTRAMLALYWATRILCRKPASTSKVLPTRSDASFTS